MHDPNDGYSFETEVTTGKCCVGIISRKLTVIYHLGQYGRDITVIFSVKRIVSKTLHEILHFSHE